MLGLLGGSFLGATLRCTPAVLIGLKDQGLKHQDLQNEGD